MTITQNITNLPNTQNMSTNNTPITTIKKSTGQSNYKSKQIKSAGEKHINPEEYKRIQANKLKKLAIKPIIRANKKANLRKNDKQYIIETLAKANAKGITQGQVANALKISQTSLSKIYQSNYDEYAKLIKKLTDNVKSKAIFKAEMGLSTIKKKGFKALNTLQCTQAVKNLFDVSTYNDKQADISINIEIPEHRNEVINYILEGTKAEPIVPTEAKE